LRNMNSAFLLGGDDIEEIVRGASKLLSSSTAPRPQWERYERENSWEENARKVLGALCEE
jgi:hypothetical protein